MKLIISGTTGVGKSTTVKLLKTELEKLGKEVHVASELVVDSPFLSLFFESLVEWGFLAQLDFLLQRFGQWVEFEKKYQTDNSNIVIIYDRHFLEDIIFSQLINVRQAVPAPLQNVYHHVYEELISKMQTYYDFNQPDFFIMLKATFDTVKIRQFEHRNRELEDLFSQKYWQDLYYRYYSKSTYRKLFVENTKNFVEINTDDLDPNEVVAKILKYIGKRTKPNFKDKFLIKT